MLICSFMGETVSLFFFYYYLCCIEGQTGTRLSCSTMHVHLDSPDDCRWQHSSFAAAQETYHDILYLPSPLFIKTTTIDIQCRSLCIYATTD